MVELTSYFTNLNLQWRHHRYFWKKCCHQKEWVLGNCYITAWNTDGHYELRGQFGKTLRFIGFVFFIDCLETCGFVSFGLLSVLCHFPHSVKCDSGLFLACLVFEFVFSSLSTLFLIVFDIPGCCCSAWTRPLSTNIPGICPLCHQSSPPWHLVSLLRYSKDFTSSSKSKCRSEVHRWPVLPPLCWWRCVSTSRFSSGPLTELSGCHHYGFAPQLK